MMQSPAACRRQGEARCQDSSGRRVVCLRSRVANGRGEEGALGSLVDTSQPTRSNEDRHLVVSSPGEFHPEALAEPDVRLAPHPAPVTQPHAERYASERTTVERVPSSCRAIGHYAAFAAVVSCICVWPTVQASGLYSGRAFASPTYRTPHSSSTTLVSSGCITARSLQASPASGDGPASPAPPASSV